jgi:hypothetical protein
MVEIAKVVMRLVSIQPFNKAIGSELVWYEWHHLRFSSCYVVQNLTKLVKIIIVDSVAVWWPDKVLKVWNLTRHLATCRLAT